MLNDATPPDTVPEPRVVEPSLNITVPVAVDGVTVAVNVTEFPYADGLRDDWTEVVDDARPTVNVPVAELARKSPWAAYVALKLWGPTDRMPTLNVATPEVNPPIDGVPPSTLRSTLPVGRSIPELTVTVTLPGAPDATEGAFILIVVGAWFTV